MTIMEVCSWADLPSEFIEDISEAPRCQVANPDRSLPVEGLPDSWILCRIPDAIICDNSVAGPLGNESMYLLQQGKSWFPDGAMVTEMLKRENHQIFKVPGTAVQLSAWCGWHFNHFVLDTLIRLGVVYERLITGDSRWRNAKIVAAFGTDGDRSTFADMTPTVQWIWHRLGLIDRLIPNNGWLIKANRTFCFDEVIFPDVNRLFKSDQSEQVRMPVFTRGVLLPIQKALGVLDPEVEQNLVIWADREEGIIRNVSPIRKKEILERIRSSVRRYNEAHTSRNPIELVEFEHTTPEADFELFRRARIALGPHGQQLWNIVFSKPGTVVIEFADWEDLFVNDDHRPCGFSLANAAGQEYRVVDTANFDGFSGRDLLPDIEQTMQIVDGVLGV